MTKEEATEQIVNIFFEKGARISKKEHDQVLDLLTNREKKVREFVDFADLLVEDDFAKHADKLYAEEQYNALHDEVLAEQSENKQEEWETDLGTDTKCLTCKKQLCKCDIDRGLPKKKKKYSGFYPTY